MRGKGRSFPQDHCRARGVWGRRTAVALGVWAPRSRQPAVPRAQRETTGEGGALTFSARSSGAGPWKSWIFSSMHFLNRSVLILLLARGLLALDCCWRG